MYPVLLVHGINDTGARFDKMRSALRAHGFDSVSAMNITPPDASITLEAMGEQVMEAVRECRQTAGAQKIDIVAFSMGALAVRHALQNVGGLPFVRRLVTVSAPHHGTLTAYLSRKSGVTQMRPGSRFLRDLNAGGGWWGDLEVFSFWSPLDLVVIPATSSVLADAHNQAFRVALHSRMLSDDRVIGAVIQALEPED